MTAVRIDLPTLRMPKWYRFRRWIKSKRRYISIVGALIVLMTYFIRDEKREGLRELVAALQTAEDEDQLRQDSERVTAILRNEDVELTSLQDAMFARHRRPIHRISPKEILQEHVDRYFYVDTNGVQQIEGIRLKLDRLRRIAKALPDVHLYDKDVQRIESEISKSTASFSLLEPYILDNQTVHPAAATRAYITSNEFANRVEAVNAGLIHADMDAAKVVAGAIDFASKALEHDDAELKKLNVLSYFLFTIGWTLALADQIFGLDGPFES